MIIDFNDPASLADWLRIDPPRFWPLLLAICRVQPRWRDNAFKARELVKAGAASVAATQRLSSL